MAHVVKTTIVTSATGEISGYGFCVEAEHTGTPEEITGAIIESLAMLRQTITASFAGETKRLFVSDPPPAPPPGQGPDRPEDQPKPGAGIVRNGDAGPPATADEAAARFYVRYGTAIGGQDWASVCRYLRQPRRPEPATVDQWIATARAVKTISAAQAAEETTPARRQYARH
jgi:hypothetical protein